MAGSERSGIDASDGTLFQGATWLLTPTSTSDHQAFNDLARLLRMLGARVLAVEPGVHDRLVAVASHLPQALASVLMAFVADAADAGDSAVLHIVAGGFRDVTRVAASDPNLWVEILSHNREAVLGAIDGFQARLGDLRDAVERGRWGEVGDLLGRARQARRSLPRKEIQGVLVDLVVPVPDQPGALARVTTALGEAGVNIEDLSMRHASEGRRGAMVVAVDGYDAAHRAQEVLAHRGIPSHVEPR